VPSTFARVGCGFCSSTAAYASHQIPIARDKRGEAPFAKGFIRLNALRPRLATRRDQGLPNPLLPSARALRVTTILHFRTPHKFHCFSIDRAARIR
jgi:hypothetical protein